MKKILGVHIAFTGIDGAGKTTLAQLLHGYLSTKVLDIIMHENSRNFISEIAYTVGHRAGFSTGPAFIGEDYYTVAMSFEVARANLTQIVPLVNNGVTVISSRCLFDWFAGPQARGCGNQAFELAKQIMLFGGLPSLTLWLDTTPSIAYDRARQRGLDTPDQQYLECLREQYRLLHTEYHFIHVIGDGSINESLGLVIDVVNKHFTIGD